MSFIFTGAVVFCAGDYLAITLNLSLLFWQIFLGAVLVSSVAAFFLKSSKKVYLGSTTLFLFAAGGFVGAGAVTVPADHISLFVNGDIYLQGEIIPGTIKEAEDGKISLQLEAEQVEQKGKKQLAQGIVRLSVSKYPKNKVFPRYGKLLVRGRLLPITGFANPGVFNSEQMARIQDIGGRMSIKASELCYEQTSKPFMAYVSDIGYAMRMKLSQTMDKRDSSVLAGMVLGGYDGIEADIVRSFSTTGIVHILSVSGSHIALLIGVVLAVMNYGKIPRKAAVIVAGLVIIGYALLCGFSPPVLRSVLMGLSMLLGISLGKDADRGAILAGVVILMLCYKPLWLWDIGFRLSFLSTAGLIYLTPQLRHMFEGKLPTCMSDSLAVCLAAQLAVIPFLVYYFHQLSPCSLIANVVVVPLIELVLIITLGGLILSFILPPLGSMESKEDVMKTFLTAVNVLEPEYTIDMKNGKYIYYNRLLRYLRVSTEVREHILTTAIMLDLGEAIFGENKTENESIKIISSLKLAKATVPLMKYVEQYHKGVSLAIQEDIKNLKLQQEADILVVLENFGVIMREKGEDINAALKTLKESAIAFGYSKSIVAGLEQTITDALFTESLK